MRGSLSTAGLVIAAVVATGCSPPGGRTVRIAAAADLARAFEELGALFEQQTHIAPAFTFDSSGLLAKRIDQGAPYALFAAASHDYAADVVAHGHCDASSLHDYAQGHIVVWTPTGVPAPANLAALAGAQYHRIAIANPDHAPYGRAAQQALVKSGVWDQVKDKLKLGENIQATLAYATSGAVDVAIVAQSLAVVATGGRRLPIDQALYEPIVQTWVVCGSGAEADAARQFTALVDSPAGRAIMTRYGFAAPP